MVLLRESVEIDALPEFECYAPPGQVIVECVPVPESSGGILLPETIQEAMRPDIGVVLAAGLGVPLSRGQKVAYNPKDGVWIEGIAFPGYEPKGQVRVFGKTIHYEGELIPVSWWLSVIMQIDGDNFQASGYNVVIERDPIVETQSGIILPDSSKFRECWATAVSVGSFANVDYDGGRLKPGDRVHYTPDGIRLRGNEVADMMPIDVRGRNLAIVQDLAINAVVPA